MTSCLRMENAEDIFFFPRDCSVVLELLLYPMVSGRNAYMLTTGIPKVTVASSSMNSCMICFDSGRMMATDMAAHRNIALSRETLLEEVWNYDYFGDDRTVDTHIKMLRRNLGEYRDCIVTVRGMGYKFEA